MQPDEMSTTAMLDSLNQLAEGLMLALQDGTDAATVRLWARGIFNRIDWLLLQNKLNAPDCLDSHTEAATIEALHRARWLYGRVFPNLAPGELVRLAWTVEKACTFADREGHATRMMIP